MARPLVTAAGLRQVLTNGAMAALFIVFAYAHAVGFVRQPRASLALTVILEGLFAFFFIVRSPASTSSTSALDWLSGLSGTWMPLLLRPTDRPDVAAGAVLQAMGVALGIMAISSLNRAIGVLPANRGIREGGAYRVVRHPVYASYTVTHAGYLMTHATFWNVGVTLTALCAQLVRIHREERVLLTDPRYAAYAQRTRWRLLPGVY